MNDRPVMVVTGASAGIGRALAERAVRAGYRVLATGRRAERLAELSREVAEAYGSLATMALDLREPRAAERIVREALAKFGRIDVLVNNAGAVAVGPIAEQSDAALREQFEVHDVVPLALLREALPSLRATRGHVFFVGSGVARIPVGGIGAYPPAKAAVRNMTRIVRGELRTDGIAVTYVDPGACASEFMSRAGFAGPPAAIAVSPALVARKIFDAIGTRKPVVNAVPWQTAFVALGEAFPDLTDALLARVPQLVGGEPLAPPPAEPAALTGTAPEGAASVEPAPEPERELTPLEAALAPHESRMRRLNLSADFVGKLLVPGATLETGEVAMRWAGMPNKNERSLTHDVLESLADARLLTRTGDDVYQVA
jgi:short-subunit dehydrogenase